jgi:hypothetical protein
MCGLLRQKLGKEPEYEAKPLVFCTDYYSKIAPAIGVTNHSQWEDITNIRRETCVRVISVDVDVNVTGLLDGDSHGERSGTG